MQWLETLRDRVRRRRAPLSLGERGERAAARHLKRLGYKIVARGSRDRIGELDLVAVDGTTVVFAEVKTRRTTGAGHPADAVDDEKQRRLTRVALSFLRRHDLLEQPTRFDVVAITWASDRKPPLIEHFPDAFPAQGHDSFFS